MPEHIFVYFVFRKFTKIVVDLEKLWAWLLMTWDFIIEEYVDYCVYRITWNSVENMCFNFVTFLEVSISVKYKWSERKRHGANTNLYMYIPTSIKQYKYHRYLYCDVIKYIFFSFEPKSPYRAKVTPVYGTEWNFSKLSGFFFKWLGRNIYKMTGYQKENFHFKSPPPSDRQ